MSTVTKSFHPLPFEHLEPRRFEDLVRQLIYDFRSWRQLEATGRAGSDDGFGARGYEIVRGDDPLSETSEDEVIEQPNLLEDLLWLVQCKREKKIGPSLLQKYLNEIPAETRAELHGIIFVGASTFSKKAYDVFRSWCSDNKLKEFHLWGIAEIEDQLYQPKNDHLLFAYFGISLQIRKQKLGTEVRRLIAIKRRLNRYIPNEGVFGKSILLRDITDRRYPFATGASLKADRCLWLPTHSKGIGALGLRVVLRRHWAYFDYGNECWDFASAIDLNIPYRAENPWYDHQVDDQHEKQTESLREFWNSLPSATQFNFVLVGQIAYDEIIDVDEVGDGKLKVPTVFVNFRDGKPPFGKSANPVLVPAGSYLSNLELDRERHVRVFPDEFRDTVWEQEWFKLNSVRYSTKLITIPPEEPMLIED